MSPIIAIIMEAVSRSYTYNHNTQFIEMNFELLL